MKTKRTWNTVEIKKRDVKKIQGRHSKFLVQNNGKIFESIAWRKSEWADELNAGDRVDLVYSLMTSEYLGEERVTLSLEDIKRA